MRIITDMDLPLKGGCVLSLGNFDGVHIGHTALLEAACKKAKELGLPSVVWRSTAQRIARKKLTKIYNRLVGQDPPAFSRRL